MDIRGPGSSFYSDNGSTFKAAAHIVPELLQSKELQSFWRRGEIRISASRRCGVELHRCGAELHRCGAELHWCGAELHRCDIKSHWRGAESHWCGVELYWCSFARLRKLDQCGVASKRKLQQCGVTFLY